LLYNVIWQAIISEAGIQILELHRAITDFDKDIAKGDLNKVLNLIMVVKKYRCIYIMQLIVAWKDIIYFDNLQQTGLMEGEKVVKYYEHRFKLRVSSLLINLSSYNSFIMY